MDKPGTLVAIGLYGPRMSDGAIGFMSKVSSCDGPPLRKIKMQRLARRGAGAGDLADRRWGSIKPPTPIAPARSNARRDQRPRCRNGLLSHSSMDAIPRTRGCPK